MAADATVLEPQRQLAALGHKVGKPDGAFGKRTEATPLDVLAKFGKTFAP